MGRFDGYVLSQLLRVFGFFALVLVGVYWINRAVILLDRYLSEGQGGGLVFQLTLLSIPAIMLIVLPIAGFVASAYVTNRLHSDSELVVVQATGYDAFRLVRPFLVFGLILALLLSLLAHLLVPLSMQRLGALGVQLADAVSSRLIVPGAFQSPTDGVTVYVRDIAADGSLQGLLVYDRRDPLYETTYNAHRALLVRHADGPRLVMFDGMAQTLNTRTDQLSTTKFEDFTVAIGGLVTTPEKRRLDYRTLSTLQLLNPSPEILDATGRSVESLRREGHLRFSQALLSVGAVVVGYAALMLGGFSRFGLSRQIVLAVLLVVTTKLVDNAAVDMAKSNPDSWPLVYAAPVFAGIVCTLLLVIANGTFAPFVRRRKPS